MPDELLTLLAHVPPWLILAALVGVMTAAACFVLAGRRVAHLGWYAILGALAAATGQVAATALQSPAPVQIGELNVAAAGLSACAAVAAARVAGL